jgi:tetratricopeptide (TPR) repeat protein
MILRHLRFLPWRLCVLAGTLALLSSNPLAARSPQLPPEEAKALEKIYMGDTQGALSILRALQTAQPENPLPVLLEAEALWWQIYCQNSSVKYGMIDAWKRGKRPEDEAYLALADKVIALSQAQLAKSNSADMHFYAGSGYALKVRLFALEGEGRAIAHAGGAARTEFLHALEIDPNYADATAGLGLYNYYGDSLSSAVKVLRFFMGIPGGDRNEGIRQMQVGIDRGVLSPVPMRFYLAKNLRNFDRQYEQAISVAEPLTLRYPQNSVFQLLLGNLNTELGRTEKAVKYFQTATHDSLIHDKCSTCAICDLRVREIASSFLAEQH